MADTMLVKVGRTGGNVQEVALNGEHTVFDALKAAKLNKKDSEIVKVNGEDIDDDTDYELDDGDVVLLVKNIEGGATL